MPTISVIVPVYNAEQYLPKCIDSILAQTFPDFELILVDDGSPDGCPAICDAYAATDSRIKVIHQQNQGQAAARNHAVSRAKGEWICFVDSDDLIHPQMLEYLYRAAVERAANISMCPVIEAEHVPSDFSSLKQYHSTPIYLHERELEQLYEAGGHRAWIACGKLIRKSILHHIPFTAGRVYEDNAVVCQWLVEAGNIADTDAELYFYRVNPAGTTKSEFQVKHLDYLWALEEIIGFFNRIKYESLLTRFSSLYMTTAASYYWRVRKELHLDCAAQNISKRMRKLHRKNRRYIHLYENEKHYAYEVMFPRTMRIYWLFKAGVRTITQDGICNFICKVIGFLHRGGKQ